jgi:hypothetical protein
MREGHDGQTVPFTWRLVPLWVWCRAAYSHFLLYGQRSNETV